MLPVNMHQLQMCTHLLFLTLRLLLQVSAIHSKDLPKIKNISFQDNVLEGEMTSVMCLAATKTKPITYEWRKDGQTLDERRDNVRFSNTNELSVLILDPVTLEDSGNYTCIAKNSEGMDKYETSLKVKAHPRWIIQPNDVITSLGSSITVYCAAAGSPEPQIKWKKYSENQKIEYLTMNTLHEKERGNSSILKISSALPEDAGYYECEADNGILPGIRTNFSITIRGMSQNISCIK
ncbi:Down syndrome cell adhesion molecule-like protein Dscam2 [Stegodyphus dumicola]|uniref:Down syndrome cell adhesion molecule-like protein Dscam2 n=1 Tax=Stegodyphus dumicola TaxID=202533 RepID=UPI0015AAB3B8|nr:Down syndrome cell adhesion molecule-like protein Dscam2 [Stegodyphus dumicola]